jgi:hypothetical protein
MAKTPSPLHAKRIPKSVSKPTETAEAAATLAETVVAAPAAKRAAKKAKPAAPVARTSTAVKSIAGPAPAVPALSGTPKAHKPKLVRDSFTMPKDEYQVIDVLKRRALALEKQVRKSELLRAGIQALAALNDRAFLKAIAGVPTLKTGRPKAD